MKNPIILLYTSLVFVCVVFQPRFVSIYCYAQAQNIKKTKTSELMDTLYLSVERNIKVGINRSIVFHNVYTNGKTIYDTRTINIKLSNPWKKNIRLIVEEMIPNSKDPKVQLELFENSDADIDFNSNRLIWNLELKPKEIRNLEVKYKVVYPQGKQIIGIQNVLQIQTYKRKTL